MCVCFRERVQIESKATAAKRLRRHKEFQCCRYTAVSTESQQRNQRTFPPSGVFEEDIVDTLAVSRLELTLVLI